MFPQFPKFFHFFYFSNSLQIYSCCGKLLSSEGCTRKHRGAWEQYSSGLRILTKYKWTCCGSRDEAAIGCYAFHPFHDPVCICVCAYVRVCSRVCACVYVCSRIVVAVMYCPCCVLLMLMLMCERYQLLAAIFYEQTNSWCDSAQGHFGDRNSCCNLPPGAPACLDTAVRNYTANRTKRQLYALAHTNRNF